MCKDSRTIKEDQNPWRFEDYYIGPWKQTIKVGSENEREVREPAADYRRSARYFEQAFIPLDIGDLKANKKQTST